MNSGSPFTMQKTRLGTEYIRSRPSIQVGTSPHDVLAKAWAESGIEGIALPVFIDELHAAGIRPRELPSIPHPDHSRNRVSKWELRIGLHVIGGSDYDTTKNS